jgi:cobalt-zinc-cadmium efflux system protein
MTNWLRSRSEPARRIIVFLLFFPFCILEVIFGHTGHSTSLYADALHTATDSASILAMLVLSLIRQRFGTVAVVEKWVERIVLWSLALFILPVVVGALYRLFYYPELAHGYTVVVIAFFGAIANLLQHWVRDTAPAEHKDHKHEVSMQHIIGDLWLNALVVIGGLATQFTGIRAVDPLVSLLIVPVVLKQLYNLSRGKSTTAMLAIHTNCKGRVA